MAADDPHRNRNEIVPLLLVIILVAASAIFTPFMVPFREFAFTDVMRLLTSLFTIALFVERSLEVFITTSRGPDAADYEARVKTVQQTRPLDTTTLDSLMKQQAKYKSMTQRYALWTGLAFGIVVSAVGVRTLETFAVASALTALPSVQLVAFRVVDVLLTGGLIAGGSEGIHKLTNVYTSFMDANAKLATARGNGTPVAPQPAAAPPPPPAAPLAPPAAMVPPP